MITKDSRSNFLMKIKVIFHLVIDVILLVFDFLKWKFFRVQSENGYRRLLSSFNLLGGSLNLMASKFLGRSTMKFQNEGILGHLSEFQFDDAIKSLKRDGYFVFENALSTEFCDALLDESLKIKGFTRVMDTGGKVDYKLFDRHSPSSVRFDYKPGEILANKKFQEIIFDQSIANFAQAYLGNAPILDLIAMWWHTTFSSTPDKEAAQWFHFDMDRLKWIKFFFYLTDVDSETGPHTFVPRTHRVFGIPIKLRRKGYTRLGDDEVSRYFPKSNWREFTGLRGTLIVEDTRGLHKGKHCISGDRLLFQLEFTSSMFGARIEDIEIVSGELSPVSREVMINNPYTYQAISLLD